MCLSQFPFDAIRAQVTNPVLRAKLNPETYSNSYYPQTRAQMHYPSNEYDDDEFTATTGDAEARLAASLLAGASATGREPSLKRPRQPTNRDDYI